MCSASGRSQLKYLPSTCCFCLFELSELCAVNVQGRSRESKGCLRVRIKTCFKTQVREEEDRLASRDMIHYVTLA